VAAAIAARAPRLDVLINNAGIWNGRRRVTAEGLEETFAVNHLAYHHLTALLTDRLRESAPARVVNVASAAHFQGRMHWDDLQLERGYLGIRAYAQSKLANVLFTYELARRLPGSGVTANCLHPGVVNTNLGRGSLNLFSLGAAFARRLYRTPEEGAVTLVHLASSPAVAGVTGRYFVDREAARSSRRSYLPDDGRRLWEASGALVSRCGG
jgi:NAD(P)-dependent dehydrogenase (short-subunit alcohol dehydrogenase family)